MQQRVWIQRGIDNKSKEFHLWSENGQRCSCRHPFPSTVYPHPPHLPHLSPCTEDTSIHHPHYTIPSHPSSHHPLSLHLVVWLSGGFLMKLYSCVSIVKITLYLFHRRRTQNISWNAVFLQNSANGLKSGLRCQFNHILQRHIPSLVNDSFLYENQFLNSAVISFIFILTFSPRKCNTSLGAKPSSGRSLYSLIKERVRC